jgi:hypothetical protein
MRVLLVHVLARMAGQLLADLERNIGIGHGRIEKKSHIFSHMYALVFGCLQSSFSLVQRICCLGA